MDKKIKTQSGVSLVELVLVVAAVAFLALLINNLPSALSSINRSRHASLAREIAGRKVDSLRKQTYANLSNGTVNFSDADLSGLPFYSASYTIENCPISVCASQEAVKQVTVEVGWKESGDQKSVQLMTMVGSGGIGQ